LPLSSISKCGVECSLLRGKLRSLYGDLPGVRAYFRIGWLGTPGTFTGGG